MKKILAILCAVCMIFALAACGESAAPAAQTTEAAPAAAPETAAETQTYTVGICQLVQHVALDAATQGFIDALTAELGDSVTFNSQNASGDPATCSVICNQFVSDEVDLIMANATPALTAAASATGSIPILGTSVTDYAAAFELDEWVGRDVALNVSGTSDGVPADQLAGVLNELFPDAKTVGLVYCSGEANSKFQADEIRPVLEGMGYTVTDYTFADSNDVAAVVGTACDENEVLYIPTDNTAASNAELINNVALEKKVPIVCGEEGICAGCGVATTSISYYDLGVVTGQMAAKVLTGTDVGSLDIEYAPFAKKYNAANCEILGIEVPAEYEAIGG